MTKKLPSLTIFFPFMNDAGTVHQAIYDAYFFGRKYAQDVEVIAIHGGNSSDNTYECILQAQAYHPKLKIINKKNNWERYAVIKYGFAAATKDWVFYTDGDLQYHLDDLEKLVAKQFRTNADVVNGYKKNRADDIIRIVAGDMYRCISKFFFRLPIRDMDCDFRLIRRSCMTGITLKSHDASILAELIKKLERAGASFSEVAVNHYPRLYGKSNYSVWSLTKEKLIGDYALWKYFRTQRNQAALPRR